MSDTDHLSSTRKFLAFTSILPHATGVLGGWLAIKSSSPIIAPVIAGWFVGLFCGLLGGYALRHRSWSCVAACMCIPLSIVIILQNVFYVIWTSIFVALTSHFLSVFFCWLLFPKMVVNDGINQCQKCGYSIRGLRSRVCPECGHVRIDRV